jgi:hypothetical protein
MRAITSPLMAAFVGCALVLALGALAFAVSWARKAFARDRLR